MSDATPRLLDFARPLLFAGQRGAAPALTQPAATADGNNVRSTVAATVAIAGVNLLHVGIRLDSWPEGMA